MRGLQGEGIGAPIPTNEMAEDAQAPWSWCVVPGQAGAAGLIQVLESALAKCLQDLYSVTSVAQL